MCVTLHTFGWVSVEVWVEVSECIYADERFVEDISVLARSGDVAQRKSACIARAKSLDYSSSSARDTTNNSTSSAQQGKQCLAMATASCQ